MKEYSQEALNAEIAFVDQDTFLFDKSIRDNIRLGNLSATNDEVEEAAKKAGCHEFIMALPNGYETMAENYNCKSNDEECTSDDP